MEKFRDWATDVAKMMFREDEKSAFRNLPKSTRLSILLQLSFIWCTIASIYVFQFETMALGFAALMLAHCLLIFAVYYTFKQFHRGIKNDQSLQVETKTAEYSPPKLMIFALVVFAWVTRVFWGKIEGLENIGDSTIALAGVLLMCITPSGEPEPNLSSSDTQSSDPDTAVNSDVKARSLLDWHAAKEIPWGMLLLFAGGICLAKGFSVSGLSALVGQSFDSITALPLILTICLICLLVTFLLVFELLCKTKVEAS